MDQRLLVGGFAEFRQENLDEYLDGVDPAWERCVNRCKKKTYFLQNCTNMAFVFQVWCTRPVSASTTRATWRRWCCWWWRTNWAGLKCAALDNKIKLHQFSQWLQIDDEEDMFATNPEEMPKRWRTKLFFSKFNLLTNTIICWCTLYNILFQPSKTFWRCAGEAGEQDKPWKAYRVQITGQIQVFTLIFQLVKLPFLQTPPTW